MSATEFTVTMANGAEFTGPVHGSGGIIRGTDEGLRRLRFAIRQANRGKDSGMAGERDAVLLVYVNGPEADPVRVPMVGALVTAQGKRAILMPSLEHPTPQAGRRRKVRTTSGTGRVLCSWCPATAVRSLWSTRDWPASWVGDACPACTAERGDKADNTLRIE